MSDINSVQVNSLFENEMHFRLGIIANITNTAPVMIEDIYTTVLSVAGENVEQRYDIDCMDWSQFFTSKQVPASFTNRSHYFRLNGSNEINSSIFHLNKMRKRELNMAKIGFYTT